MGRRRRRANSRKTQVFPEERSNVNCEFRGYYYDEAQKRYFRLPQGPWDAHLAHLQHAQELLCEKLTQNTPKPMILPQLILNRSTGVLNTQLYRSLCSESRIRALEPVVYQNVLTGDPFHNPQLKNGHCSFLVSHPNISAAIAVVSFIGTHQNKIMALNVEPTRPVSEIFTAFPIADTEVVLDRVMDVRAIEWFNDDVWLMSCTVGGFRDPSYAYMCNVLGQSGVDEMRPPMHKLRFEGCATYSCDWNKATLKALLGQDRRAVVCDLANGIQPVFTSGNAALASRMSPDGRLAFTGLRSGYLQCTDLRDRPRDKYAYRVHLEKALSEIELLESQDVVVSGYGGLLATVDLRFRKVKVEFEGHVNENRKIKFNVEEAKGVLCSVGQDGLTRFWNLGTGKRIHTFKPPLPVTADNFPPVCYRSSWASSTEKNVGQGMLMFVNCMLVLYQSY